METLQTNQLANPKKYEFEVQLNWLSEETGVLSATDANGVLRVSTPKEFGGKGKEWSPEHLLLGAVTSCFMSTYLTFAKKFRFEINRLECNAEGIIEPVDGVLRFTAINIHPKIYVDNYDFMSKARLALEKAEKYCLVSNSLSAKIKCRGDVIAEKSHGNKQ
jgi:peroxiredoxin-like protein